MISTRAKAICRRLSARAAILLIGMLVVSCTGRNEAQRVPLGRIADSGRAEHQAHALLGPAAKAALDSGNVLFRRKMYAEALAQYRSASELAPQHSAPLFGIYMVGRATNNKAMADSALIGIRVRNGPMPAGPHSLPDTALQRIHDSLRRRPTSS
jgi:hypothetical protein